MRTRMTEKFEMYLLSLWLLFILVIIVTLDIPCVFRTECTGIDWRELLRRNAVPMVALALVVAGVVFYFRFDYRIAGSTSIPVPVSSVKNMDYDHLTFLTTYIIPLISFNLSNYRYLLAVMVLLVVIGVIYIRTDLFYANPTLAVLGFRVYSATMQTRTGRKVDAVLILRDELHDGNYVKYLQLDDRVYFARRVKSSGGTKAFP